MRRAGEPRAYIEARVSVEDRGYSSPCWIWQLGLTEKGYGCCTWGGKHSRSHRIAYIGFVGPLSDDLQIDHLCRVKSCCNPEHLEAVTNAENQRRNRGLYRKEFCKRGHQLTDDNRYVEMKDGAVRASGCRICRRENGTAYMREWSKANPRSDSYRNEYKRLWKQRRKEKTRAELSGGAGEGSDAGLGTHNSGALSQRSHLGRL